MARNLTSGALRALVRSEVRRLNEAVSPDEDGQVREGLEMLRLGLSQLDEGRRLLYYSTFDGEADQIGRHIDQIRELNRKISTRLG
jgi:hypothetical protein